MEELVLVGEGPLDSLVLVVHGVRVVGQTLIVADVLIQGIPIVSCRVHKQNTFPSE